MRPADSDTACGLDRDDFREVARKLRPDIDDETFDQMWEQFMRDKYLKSLH